MRGREGISLVEDGPEETAFNDADVHCGWAYCLHVWLHRWMILLYHLQVIVRSQFMLKSVVNNRMYRYGGMSSFHVSKSSPCRRATDKIWRVNLESRQIKR
jgi:hypothetical protein